MKKNLIQLELCCLDDNGDFDGHVISIDLYAHTGKASLHIAMLQHDDYPDSDGGAHVGFYRKQGESSVSPWNQAARWCQIGEAWLKLASVPSSGGNIYWLTFLTPADDAAELIGSLHTSKVWSWTYALDWFGDAWDDTGFAMPQLKAALAAECSGNEASE